MNVKSFQRKHGLVIDGIAGPQTRAVMRELARPVSRRARKEPDKSAVNHPLSRVLRAVKAAIFTPSSNYTSNIVIPATARPIIEIIFHCAATPEGRWFDRNDVNAWHKQRGWEMIGYHFLILLDGTIQIGRPIGMIGAHVADHNVGTVGVAYVGGLSKDGKTAKDTRTLAQKNAAAWLIRRVKKQFAVRKRVKGHNEYDAGKACPSFRVINDFLATL